MKLFHYSSPKKKKEIKEESPKGGIAPEYSQFTKKPHKLLADRMWAKRGGGSERGAVTKLGGRYAVGNAKLDCIRTYRGGERAMEVRERS